MMGGGVRNNYFGAVSQLIFMLIKYLKKEKSRSGLLGLILENVSMRIFSEVRQIKIYMKDSWGIITVYSFCV